MTNATNRTLLRCKTCGHMPGLYAILPGESGEPQDDSVGALSTTRLDDDQWTNGIDVDHRFRYSVRCSCYDTVYDNPAAAAEAWHQSGPGVSQEWWQKFLRLVGEVQSDQPFAYENLVEHVGRRIACNQPEFRNSSPGWPQDEPEFGPIGYISESAKHMLQQGTKAFIRPQRDSLAKLPVYVGKPDVS